MNDGRAEATSNDVAERIVMVGAAIPQDVMDALMTADRSPQIQTHKTSWAVVRGIESTGKVLDLISTVALSDYPWSDWLWSGYRKWDRANGSDNWLVPFINILGWKHLTRFLGCLTFLVWWSIKHRGQKRHVLLYGLLSAHLYAVLCVRLLFSMKTTVLMTDAPGVPIRREPWWRRLLRPIDRALIYRAMRAMDGLIVLARQMGEDYAPNTPMIVMEGVLSLEVEELSKTTPEPRSRPKEFVVFYAGALGRMWGIPMLLDAFAELPGGDFRLWLFGRGDMEDEIRRRAKEDPRICYPGVLIPTKELFQRSQQATVLINPRPSSEYFARYSFPSKVLEYMAAGRPIVTTRLSTMPEEYAPYLLYLDQETPTALAALLRRLHEQPPEQLDDLGRRARRFVLQEKTYRQQGKRIVKFIQHINSL